MEKKQSRFQSRGLAYSRKSKNGTPYIAVIVKEDIPANTELLLFARKEPKKADSDPDFQLVQGEERQRPQAPQQAKTGTGGGFPF